MPLESIFTKNRKCLVYLLTRKSSSRERRINASFFRFFPILTITCSEVNLRHINCHRRLDALSRGFRFAISLDTETRVSEILDSSDE